LFETNAVDLANLIADLQGRCGSKRTVFIRHFRLFIHSKWLKNFFNTEPARAKLLASKVCETSCFDDVVLFNFPSSLFSFFTTLCF
jgi:hypothetical protein